MADRPCIEGGGPGLPLPPVLIAFPKCPGDGPDVQLQLTYRLDPNPHTPVQFARPEGPGKLHWGYGFRSSLQILSNRGKTTPRGTLSIALSAIPGTPLASAMLIGG